MTSSLDPSELAGAPAATVFSGTAPDAMSLFPADQQVLSDEALTSILNGQLQLPPTLRLAVVTVGQTPNFTGFAPEFAETSRAIDSSFLGALRSSERVEYAQYLPGMLRPQRITVPDLRESAARYRADMLLIISTQTREYRNDRLLGKDRVRAFSDVEVVLVDVRSGTVPFSTNTSEDFLAVKAGDDLNFQDTIARANQTAIGNAWIRVATETAEYLNSVDAVAPPVATAPVQE